MAEEYFKVRIFSFELECSIDGKNRVLERLEKSLINYAYKNLKVESEPKIGGNRSV